MTIALYRYRPASARSLAVLAGADSKSDAARLYFADLLRIVAMGQLSGDAPSIPTLHEIFSPRPRDMSKKEIKEMILGRLRKANSKGDKL